MIANFGAFATRNGTSRPGTAACSWRSGTGAPLSSVRRTPRASGPSPPLPKPAFSSAGGPNGVTAMIFPPGDVLRARREGIVLPPEIPLEELRKFLGEYHGDELDETLEIVIKNNSLALKISDRKPTSCVPRMRRENDFFRVAPLVYLVFQRIGNGRRRVFYFLPTKALVFNL